MERIDRSLDTPHSTLHTRHSTLHTRHSALRTPHSAFGTRRGHLLRSFRAMRRGVIEKVGNADNLAEFGIGLNPLSRRNGHFQEEKKARGNVHAALGDNQFYGGDIQSAVHIDMVMYRPTVVLDEHVIVDDGKIQLPAA